MKLEIPLDRMTTEEKWEALETLWADLSSNPANVPVPDWHRTILDERLRDFEAGKTNFSEASEVLERIRRKLG
jgi:hypothetical protein